jgi:hypothetical protein
MKRIEVSDEAYRRLKRESDDQSFSEAIADALDSDGRLEDVIGQQVLDPESGVTFEADTERPSDGSADSEDTRPKPQRSRRVTDSYPEPSLRWAATTGICSEPAACADPSARTSRPPSRSTWGARSRRTVRCDR